MVNAKNALDVADLTIGDHNGDGLVTNADLVLIGQYLVSLTTLTNYQLYCSDVNFDGVINNTDLILIAQMVVA